MGRKRIYATEADRRRAQDAVRKLARASHAIDFCPVDGEGIGRGREHKYVLLGTDESYIRNPDGITTEQSLSYVWDTYLSRPQNAIAGFYLGYDFTQWLKGLNEHAARMLFTDEGIKLRKRTRSGGNPTPFPVYWHDWELDILGMKRLKVRPKGEKTWAYVNDAGPFFQASLLTVIDPEAWPEPICTLAEYELIRKGKERRDHAELDQDMIDYMLLENTILRRLLIKLNEGFTDMDIKLKRDQWYGPGQAAQKWLGTTNTPTVAQIASSPLKKWQEYGRKAYYGGWFEIFAHGHIPGLSWEYDINSAYPYVASGLPCLLHGAWHRYGDIRRVAKGTDTIRAVHGTFAGTDDHAGAMLHRDNDGNISRPSQVTGWYWWSEVQAAMRAGLISHCSIDEVIEYVPCDCPAPLAGLANLYDKRIAIGKDTPHGKSSKLVYNSVYGKLAQSIGNPKFSNSLYASLVTSGCRTIILDAIATHPERTGSLLMVATDAVFFRSKHTGLEISKKLGQWSETERHNLTLFKPGVYWDDKARHAIAENRPAIFKARGINARAFSQCIADIDGHFGRWGTVYPVPRDPVGEGREGWWPQVSFESGFSMVTPLQALSRDKWFLAGSVGPGKHEDDSWPGLKRRSGEYRDGVYWSRPPESAWGPSQEYVKRFGIPEQEMTPDGPLLTLIREAIR